MKLFSSFKSSGEADHIGEGVSASTYNGFGFLVARIGRKGGSGGGPVCPAGLKDESRFSDIEVA